MKYLLLLLLLGVAACASKPVIMVNCQKASDPYYICEKP